MPIVQPKTVVSGTAINVEDLLSSKNEIPNYQRDYIWKTNQIEQLWDDLFEHYYQSTSHDKLKTDPKGYFLGAMVVINNSDGQLEIVDGQQRLTSLTIMTSIMYDLISNWSDSNPAKVGLAQRLIKMLGYYDQDWKSNLKFQDSELNEFFLESCVKCKSRDNKNTLWESEQFKYKLLKKNSTYSIIKSAFTAGYNKLNHFIDKNESPETKEKRLESLINIFTQGIVCLRIEANSYSSAYAIFESLNNRGIPLSQADLVKNELLKTVDDENLEYISETWNSIKDIINNLDVISLPDFIHHSFISRNKHIKAKDLYSSVKNYVQLEGGSRKYIDELLQDAIALERVTVNFDSSWETSTTSMLKDIKNVLGIKFSYPYLIAAYRKYHNNKSEFSKHVTLIMNFSFRYIKIMNRSVESFASTISACCELINKDTNIEECKKILKKNAPDLEFIKEFEESSITNIKLAYFTVFYLEKIQLAGTIPIDHGNDQNLEHIMPKNPTEEDWPDAYSLKKKSSDIFKDYLWRIGNLLPLPANINKSLKNKNIKYKIKNSSGKDYTSPNSHSLISPRKVSDYLVDDKWTTTSIDKRQAFLATHYATKAWSLD